MENTTAHLCVWDELITIALIKIQPKLQINNWTFTLEFWKYLATYLFESLREIKIIIFKEFFFLISGPWSLLYVHNWSLKFEASIIGPSSFKTQLY